MRSATTPDHLRRPAGNVDARRYIVTPETPDGCDADLDHAVILDADGHWVTEASTLAHTEARAVTANEHS